VAERSKAHDWKSCRVNSPPGFESLPFRHFLSPTPRLAIPPRAWLVLTACALLVLAFAPAQYFGRQQDDLLYYFGARSLASGRYCLETSPGCPPLAMINPGWPLLLTPLALVTDRPAAFQAFAALLLALAPLAAWAWLRRRFDETTALLGAALIASSPLALAQAGVPMSEAPFLLVLLALLAATESRRAPAAGALGAFLLMLRTAGAAALPAALIPFLLARRARAAAAAALPPLAAYALWSAWSWSRTRGVDKISLLAATYRGGAPLKLASVAAANARYYAAAWGSCFLPPRLAGGAAALALGLALGAAALAGVVRALRRRRDDPAAWALLGFAVLHALWGWQYERYLVPLLPLLVWALAEACGRAAKPALAVLLVLQLGGQTLPRLGRPSPYAEPELARSYAWLAARPRPALLASAENVRDGWYAGLPSVPLPDEESAEGFAASLKKLRVAYVLREDAIDVGLGADAGSAARRGLERAFAHLDDARFFRKVHQEPDEGAEIYEPL
jgi:hypothetical protein